MSWLTLGGALFNQGHLVAAQQPQLLQEGILLGERFPVRTIQAQGVGKAPAIQVIAFGAALGLCAPGNVARLWG
jgi:hypothetical protein